MVRVSRPSVLESVLDCIPSTEGRNCVGIGSLNHQRRLASRGHYPPIDVMESISRSMKDVTSDTHWERAMEIKGLVAAYAEAEDLVNIGAYARGSNPRIDRALEYIEPIEQFLTQAGSETGSFDHHVQRLMGILAPPAPVEPEA